MKFKNIITFTLVAVFAFTATLIATPTAYAACSYNGYLNSGGACSSSIKIKNNERYNYQFQNQSYYGDLHQQSLLAMIVRLQEMIRLLERQLGDRVIYDDDDDSEVSVTTRTATNIEDDRATLRGMLYLNNEDEADVYFEYGRTRTNLNEETSLETIDDDDGSVRAFSERIDDLNDGTLYYYRAVAEDEDGDEDYGSILSFRTDGSSNNDDEPDLNTRDAEEIEDNSAELRGTVDMNDFNNGIVFFVYGEDESQVEDIADDYDRYTDIDEDGDDLQKVLVDNDLDTSASYRKDISNLDADTKIYHSICIEYEDEDDDEVIACGDTESFTTGDDSSNNDDEPDLNTRDADDITDDSAELNGTVDMNDFSNGKVFFVYGEDENQVEDVANDYDRYTDIDEDGDDLQKVLVDNDLDSSATYYADIGGLDDNTDIYFSICVEYEDEDNDDVIACGDVEMFETD